MGKLIPILLLVSFLATSFFAGTDAAKGWSWQKRKGRPSEDAAYRTDDSTMAAGDEWDLETRDDVERFERHASVKELAEDVNEIYRKHYGRSQGEGGSGGGEVDGGSYGEPLDGEEFMEEFESSGHPYRDLYEEEGEHESSPQEDDRSDFFATLAEADAKRAEQGHVVDAWALSKLVGLGGEGGGGGADWAARDDAGREEGEWGGEVEDSLEYEGSEVGGAIGGGLEGEEGAKEPVPSEDMRSGPVDGSPTAELHWDGYMERSGNASNELRHAMQMLYESVGQRNVSAAIGILIDLAAQAPRGDAATAYWRPPYYPDDAPENDTAAGSGAAVPAGEAAMSASFGASSALAGEDSGLGDSQSDAVLAPSGGVEVGEGGQEFGMSPVSSAAAWKTNRPKLGGGSGGSEPRPNQNGPGLEQVTWGGGEGVNRVAEAPSAADSQGSGSGSESTTGAVGAEGRDDLEMSASDAMFLLGVLSSLGITPDILPRNESRAVEYFIKAADLGSLQAMLALSTRYAQGWGVRKSCRTAFWYVSTAANEMMLQAEDDGDFQLPPEPVRLRERHRSASYMLTIQNEDHIDQVDMDEDLAMRGIPDAQRHVGYRQLIGRGMDRDPDAAFRHFQAAANQGDQAAAFNLGYMFMKGISVPVNYTTARELFLKAAMEGLPAAFNGLGVLHFNGWGVPLDYAEARRYFEMGAMPQHNNTDSFYNLGSIYLMGYGIEKNATKAFEYFEKASEHDHWRAPYMLALMHSEGTGTPANCSHAVRLMSLFVSERKLRSLELEDAAAAFDDGDYWSALVRYGILAEQGCSVGAENAAFILRRGLGYTGPARHDIGLDLVLRSAAAGNLYSFIDAGDLHYFGLVSNPNGSLALRYYEKAAAARDPEGLYSLAYMHQHGIVVERNFTRAEELLLQALGSFGKDSLAPEEALPVTVALWWLRMHRTAAQVHDWVHSHIGESRMMAAFLEYAWENIAVLVLTLALCVVCYQIHLAAQRRAALAVVEQEWLDEVNRNRGRIEFMDDIGTDPNDEPLEVHRERIAGAEENGGRGPGVEGVREGGGRGGEVPGQEMRRRLLRT